MLPFVEMDHLTFSTGSRTNGYAAVAFEMDQQDQGVII